MSGVLLWVKKEGTEEWVPAIANDEGKLLIAKHEYETPANTGVDVGVASTLILALNADRLYAAIVNHSDTDIWISLGAAAILDQGIPLNAHGGSYEINWTNLYTGAIYGIHGGTGNKRVGVMEGD